MKSTLSLIAGLLLGVLLVFVSGSDNLKTNPPGTFQVVIGPNFNPSVEGMKECPYVINTRTGEVWNVSMWKDEIENIGGYSWHCWGGPDSKPGKLGKVGDLNLVRREMSAALLNADVYLRKTGVGYFKN